MKKQYLYFCYLFLILHFTLVINNGICQWVQKSNGMGNISVESFTQNGNFIFVGTYSPGIYRTSDNGENWFLVNNGIPGSIFSTRLISYGNYIFVSVYGLGVYKSTDMGLNWTYVAFAGYSPTAFTISGNYFFAGTTSNGVYLSTNTGVNWTNIFQITGVYCLASKDSNIFAGTWHGLYHSTNNGINWNYVNIGSSNNNISAVEINGNNIYTCDYSVGIFRSTNNGTNWTLINNGLLDFTLTTLAFDGNYIFAGTENGGVYLSSNNGNTWIPKNQGYTYHTNCFTIKNGFIFAGTYGHSVWRRTISDITGINKISENVPLKFSLTQNYPNPFNPVTNIRYNLSKNCYVKLIVFDALGHEVESLVNEKQNAGIYEVSFNASQYPSGVYFYRLVTDYFKETKQMVLIK